MLHLSQETHKWLHPSHSHSFLFLSCHETSETCCTWLWCLSPGGTFFFFLSWRKLWFSSFQFVETGDFKLSAVFYAYLFFFTPKIKPLLWITIYNLEGIKIYWWIKVQTELYWMVLETRINPELSFWSMILLNEDHYLEQFSRMQNWQLAWQC